MNSAQRRAVVAIGGNALIAGPSRLRFADQLSVARRTVQPVADMVADGWQVTVVHGNGPQVGFEVRRSELAAAELPELPLEVSVAQTQGSMGFLLQQALGEALAERRLETQAVTLITRTEVDPDDPAFRAPTKPIGSFLDAGEAEAAREDGWVVIEDAGRGWRRVVASPRPRRIVEAEVVGSLLDDGVVVMAAGGGGIPVVPRPGGGWEGVAAVIDKDLAACLLAVRIGAELLAVSTSVDRVALDFGQPEQRFLDAFTLDEARGYLAEGRHFAAGSMAPKIQAAVEFLEAEGDVAPGPRGRWVVITDPHHLADGLRGTAGTTIKR